MASNYSGAVVRLKAALEAHLAGMSSDRVVTRTYKDLGEHKAADLRKGIFTILCRGVDGYDYEASDHSGGIDAPAQTELGQFVLVITGQGSLQDKAEGEAIDEAEFAMLAELESFADQGITDEDLKDLLLKRTVMSQQLEAPYYWVMTEWRLRLFD
jgi:hypothetical protein